jgi:hypothetical protein
MELSLYVVADQFGDGVRNHLRGQVNTIVITYIYAHAHHSASHKILVMLLNCKCVWF